ncbi:hypothetical protein BCR41DRAFT_371330 [Lobosporangium transversale]|uniref:Uncharacterized protein n=1 Tax=Lobosporangium transversale TaxID=64571 RepID=A0A1Y2GKF2_9FUNG|nr:hypothetical protein BCR41DRAFT_371330 [Lobosporangium transversale]ORZ13807.1 hypothetical protein BCR41DRAFT_371330 [Lobosporangium transversale]|eukprot:XP_021880591.1 hypothetical protein BCR41DRAFT_371330 [Lobosporangium transversale]
MGSSRHVVWRSLRCILHVLSAPAILHSFACECHLVWRPITMTRQRRPHINGAQRLITIVQAPTISFHSPIQSYLTHLLTYKGEIKTDTSKKTIKAEWIRWILYFRECPVQIIRERAATAPPMDSSTITTYLEQKLNNERVIDLLKINSEQLLLTGNAQTRSLRSQWGNQAQTDGKRKLSAFGAKASTTNEATLGTSSVCVNTPSSRETLDQTITITKESFDDEDNVHEFFFRHARIKLDRYWSFYQLFVESLRSISKNPNIDPAARDVAKTAIVIRESRFRTEFFKAEEIFVKAAANINNSSEVTERIRKRHYLGLLDDLPSSQDSSDSFSGKESFSRKKSNIEREEDHTGELPEPMNADRLVGPGTISSSLSNGPESQLVCTDGYSISEALMRYRRVNVIQKVAATVEDILLSNFIVSRPLLLKVLPISVVQEMFPIRNPLNLDTSDMELVVRLTTRASVDSFDELQDWLATEPRMTSSVIYRTISIFLAEADLWAGNNWHIKGSGDNEDTFIDNLLKPISALQILN